MFSSLSIQQQRQYTFVKHCLMMLISQTCTFLCFMLVVYLSKWRVEIIKLFASDLQVQNYGLLIQFVKVTLNELAGSGLYYNDSFSHLLCT